MDERIFHPNNYPPTQPTVHQSSFIHPATHSIHNKIHLHILPPPIHPPVNPFMHTFIYLVTHSSVYTYVHSPTPIFSPTHPHIQTHITSFPPMHPPTHSPTHPSIIFFCLLTVRRLLKAPAGVRPWSHIYFVFRSVAVVCCLRPSVVTDHTLSLTIRCL